MRHGVALAMDLANDIDVRGAYEECQRLPEKLHESWLEEKRQDGWTYSTIKDSDAKTHPCMLPWAELPKHQQAKDDLFMSVVIAMKAALDEGLA